MAGKEASRLEQALIGDRGKPSGVCEGKQTDDNDNIKHSSLNVVHGATRRGARSRGWKKVPPSRGGGARRAL